MKSKQAERFRQMADSLQETIDDKLAPRKVNTHKRQREAAKAEADARYYKLLQDKLRALADALDAIDIPDELTAIKTKVQVENLLTYKTFPDHDEAAVKRLHKAHIHAGNYDAARHALLKMGDPDAGKRTPEDHQREIEREVLLRDIPGFFPTPPDVIAQMIDLAGIDDDGTEPLILEPSAGRGDIVDAIIAENPKAVVMCCEINPSLCRILELKGHDVTAGNFLDQTTYGIYDLVLMNPPLDRMEDIDHVQHAYKMLKQGGRLVSVMGEGVFSNESKQAENFRTWLKQQDFTDEQLPADAFKNGDRPTSMRTRLVVINKPPKERTWYDEYQRVRKEEPNCDVLLYRIGAFFNIYDDDAERAQKVLPHLKLHDDSRDDWSGRRAGIPQNSLKARVDQLYHADLNVVIAEPTGGGLVDGTIPYHITEVHEHVPVTDDREAKQDSALSTAIKRILHQEGGLHQSAVFQRLKKAGREVTFKDVKQALKALELLGEVRIDSYFCVYLNEGDDERNWADETIDLDQDSQEPDEEQVPTEELYDNGEDRVAFALAYPVAQVKNFWGQWTAHMFERALAMEKAGKNRKTLIAIIERELKRQREVEDDSCKAQLQLAREKIEGQLDHPGDLTADILSLTLGQVAAECGNEEANALIAEFYLDILYDVQKVGTAVESASEGAHAPSRDEEPSPPIDTQAQIETVREGEDYTITEVDAEPTTDDLAEQDQEREGMNVFDDILAVLQENGELNTQVLRRKIGERHEGKTYDVMFFSSAIQQMIERRQLIDCGNMVVKLPGGDGAESEPQEQLSLLPPERLPPPEQWWFTVSKLVHPGDDDTSPYVWWRGERIFLHQITPRKKLRESLHALGQLQALIVIERADASGRLEIVDGLHRVNEWHTLLVQGEIDSTSKVIRADVYNSAVGWDLDAVIGLTVHAHREDNPIAELVRIEALAAKGADEKTIARDTGLPVQTVRKRLKMRQLRPELRQAWEDGKMATGTAERAAVLPKNDQAGLVEVLAEKDKVTHDDVHHAREVEVNRAVSMFDPEMFKTPDAEDAMVGGETLPDQALQTLETLAHASDDGMVTVKADAMIKLIAEVRQRRALA